MTIPTQQLQVSIDKLALGLPMTAFANHLRRVVKKNLDDVVVTYGGRTLSTQGKGYRHRYRIPILGDEAVFIDYRPNKPGHALYALRLEFNPNKLGSEGCQTVRHILHELFGDNSRRLLEQLVIVSADWCVDLPGLSVADVIVHTSGKQLCRTWGKHFGRNAEIETLYEGTPASDHQVRTYNKSRQLLSALVQKQPLIKIADLEQHATKLGNCMRIEVSTKNRGIHPSMLSTLKNPFEGTHIYSLPQVAGSLDDDFGRLFIEAVRSNGLNVALALIQDVNCKRRLKREVAKHRMEWWDPNVFADQIVEAVKTVGIFPASAFTMEPSSVVVLNEARSAMGASPTSIQVGPLSRMRPMPGSGRALAGSNNGPRVRR